MSYFNFNPGVSGLLGNGRMPLPQSDHGPLPDHMPGIMRALEDNAAKGQEKGGFNVMDALVGFFAPDVAMMKQKQRMLEHERDMQRQQDLADFFTKEEYKRKHQDDAPEWEKTARWLEAQGRADEAADVRAKATMVPVSTVDPATNEVRYEYRRPSMLSGSSRGNEDATPTVEDGYQYTPGPGGRANQANWRPISATGGASPGGSPTFP